MKNGTIKFNSSRLNLLEENTKFICLLGFHIIVSVQKMFYFEVKVLFEKKKKTIIFFNVKVSIKKK